MKDNDLLFFVLVFFVGMCFRKTMCNNGLIEGEEAFDRTCTNIDASSSDMKTFQCNYDDGEKLKGNPSEIICEDGGCTNERCCYPKKSDDNDNDNDKGKGFFIGLIIAIITFWLIILAAKPVIAIVILTICLIGSTVVFGKSIVDNSDSPGLMILIAIGILAFEFFGGIYLARKLQNLHDKYIGVNSNSSSE